MSAVGAPQHRLAWLPSIGVIVFLLIDGVFKLVPTQQSIETVAALGWPTDHATVRGLGVLLIGATLLYAWPRSALVGAILLTAYLGGTVATHVRIGSPLFSQTLFGFYIGLLLWHGLWLRDPRLRGIW